MLQARLKTKVSQDTIKTFTLPAIPQIMVAPEQRAEFLVKHYWDNVNFADTNYIHHPEITEQAWVDYCDILNHVPPQNRTGSYTQNDRPHKRRQESIRLHHRFSG